MARNNKRKTPGSGRKENKTRKPSRILWILLKWLFILGLLAGLAGVAALAGVFYYYGRDLPELLEREDYDPPQMSRVYAADGEMIAEFFITGGRRTVVPLEEIPPVVMNAFMAAEDSDFMIHSGIDYFGLIRAFYYAARYDQGMRGTSTITQQLVKNLILTHERSYERKLQEIILARELEKNLTKEDILYMYLNTIYLGHGTNGVEEASRFYFGKSVGQLNLPEAALLAGLTQSPESLTPVRHPERALRRRSYVLRQLWEKGFIEEAAYREAEASEIVLADPRKTFPHRGKAPYFVEHVRKDLVERYGEDKVYTGGLRVYTTVDLKAQEAAERAARKGLREYDERQKYYRPQRKLAEKDIEPFLKKQVDSLPQTLSPNEVYEAVVIKVDATADRVDVRLGNRTATLRLTPRSRIVGEGPDTKPLDKVLERGHVLKVQPVAAAPADLETFEVRFETGAEAAVIALDPHTREVLALVGGYDFSLNQFDSATQARRQTGSAFKTLVFAAAIEEKIATPATIYLDSPSVFQLHGGQSWSPKNADGQWRGPISVREGLASSRNVVSVRLLDDVGIPRAIEFARKVGISSHLVDNYTMVMGSSEMPPMEITNAYATLAAGGFLAQPRFLKRVESVHGDRELFTTDSKAVIAPEVAYLVTSMLDSAVNGFVDSHGNRRAGTGNVVRSIGHPIAGKTGTTNDSRDAWFIGYTPKLVSGVWVGFSDNRSLGARQYGGNVAAPIFRDFMTAALEGRPKVSFEAPTTGITTARIDPRTGKLARTGGIEEIFLVGTAPTEFAPTEDEGSAETFLLNQFQDFD
jgi:penicillin-binding protein 1A